MTASIFFHNNNLVFSIMLLILLIINKVSFIAAQQYSNRKHYIWCIISLLDLPARDLSETIQTKV